MLAYNYLMKQVVNSTTYLMADSIEPYDVNCTALPKYNVTYNAGMFIGGLVELFKATGNDSYVNLAHKIAQAIIDNNAPEGVLLEYCDWDEQCSNDDDGKLFKGIFVRNLRYLMDVCDSEKQVYYQKFLQTNIDSVLKNSQCEDPVKTNCSVKFLDGPSGKPTQGPVFGTSWVGAYNFSNVISQTEVLDLFIAAVDPSVECKGDQPCGYQPEIPEIHQLTCKDKPCPEGHACCAWDKIYATCCMPYQVCEGGGCY